MKSPLRKRRVFFIPEPKVKDNNIKAIKTRSGHLIELKDTDGEESITITDKNSNKIFLNTKDSSISITAPANLSLNADTIDINAKNTITMTSKESTITVKSKENTTVESTDANFKLTAKQNVDLQSTDAAATVMAKTGASLLSDDLTLVDGKSELNLHGGKANMNADSQIRIESPDTDSI